MAADGAAGDLLEFGASELRERAACGALRAAEFVDVCLDRIAQLEDAVGAWAWRDADFARHQAREVDRHRASGRPVGALHGLPVGLSDLIDTARIPTENGCRADTGRIPPADAHAVARLKQGGAVLMGKTATSELGGLEPGPTANPHDPARIAGSVSAGCAAVVAAGMVPLALGTDAGGEAALAAAWCGVTGYVPSFGAIPRTGVLARAPSVERMAIFARNPVDAALLAETLCGHDSGDRATWPAPTPQLLASARAAPPLAPLLAVIRPTGWADAEAEAQTGFSELVARLGEQAFEVDLPTHFADAPALLDRVRVAEAAHCLHRYLRHPAGLEDGTREALARGADIRAADYLAALDWREVFYAGLVQVLQRADAILAPAAPGLAPLRTSPEPPRATATSALWAFCGLPSVTMPILQSSCGLPMGAQLIAARDNDARLLRTANWLYHRIDP
jgi:aspartyl-tRNA(Asn)/glutamyl-tRNA(Gln) amidotransferase subunit A